MRFRHRHQSMHSKGREGRQCCNRDFAGSQVYQDTGCPGKFAIRSFGPLISTVEHCMRIEASPNLFTSVSDLAQSTIQYRPSPPPSLILPDILKQQTARTFCIST